MLKFLADLVAWIISSVLSVLPRSPFVGFDWGSFGGTGLGWLNWFFPVSGALSLMGLWLVAIGGWYIWSTLVAWLKVGGEG